jgi:hypothetical protein
MGVKPPMFKKRRLSCACSPDKPPLQFFPYSVIGRERPQQITPMFTAPTDRSKKGAKQQDAGLQQCVYLYFELNSIHIFVVK